jgi:hypothetical protein
MPKIFAKIGCAAVPQVVKLLQNAGADLEARNSAVSYLESIGKAHPECRDLCVAELTEQLQHFAESDPTLNGFIVGALVLRLHAVESAGVIEAAFEADRVDESIMGDWYDAQVGLGLMAPEDVPYRERKSFWAFQDGSGSVDSMSQRRFYVGGAEKSDAQKAKRQQQKQARRKNRGKK